MDIPATSAPPAGRPEIPGYEVLDTVGHGPLGVVFRAKSAGGNPAAIKIFNPVVRWRPGGRALASPPPAEEQPAAASRSG